MYEFIVLGLIPGTQIQITFMLWIVVVACVAALFLLLLGRKTHTFRSWLVTLSLLLLSKQFTYRQLKA